jgi:hypothetical protein
MGKTCCPRQFARCVLTPCVHGPGHALVVDQQVQHRIQDLHILFLAGRACTRQTQPQMEPSPAAIEHEHLHTAFMTRLRSEPHIKLVRLLGEIRERAVGTYEANPVS